MKTKKSNKVAEIVQDDKKSLENVKVVESKVEVSKNGIATETMSLLLIERIVELAVRTIYQQEQNELVIQFTSEMMVDTMYETLGNYDNIQCTSMKNIKDSRWVAEVEAMPTLIDRHAVGRIGRKNRPSRKGDDLFRYKEIGKQKVVKAKSHRSNASSKSPNRRGEVKMDYKLQQSLVVDVPEKPEDMSTKMWRLKCLSAMKQQTKARAAWKTLSILWHATDNPGRMKMESKSVMDVVPDVDNSLQTPLMVIDPRVKIKTNTIDVEDKNGKHRGRRHARKYKDEDAMLTSRINTSRMHTSRNSSGLVQLSSNKAFISTTGSERTSGVARRKSKSNKTRKISLVPGVRISNGENPMVEKMEGLNVGMKQTTRKKSLALETILDKAVLPKTTQQVESKARKKMSAISSVPQLRVRASKTSEASATRERTRRQIQSNYRPNSALLRNNSELLAPLKKNRPSSSASSRSSVQLFQTELLDSTKPTNAWQ